MVLECHERIRRFVSLAEVLAAPPADATPEQISEAARDVLRYFTVALPLHEEDEEKSIAPRLAGKSLGADAERTLAELAPQHREIEELVAALMRRWREIAGEPERIGTLRTVIGAPTKRLKQLFDAHLEGEEKRLLPAVRKALDKDELAKIKDEIAARRR
jgi:hemerythrin-like domain-containing protein